MQYDDFTTHSIDMYMGKPKSGKTIIAGSYPKPLLYCSVGNDGGGRVLKTAYAEDVKNGNIKVKNLRNDYPVNGKIKQTSIEKLAILLAELRKPGADKFRTIVIDTIGALQDDYKTYLEFSKGGKALSQQEWGDVAKMVLNIKDNMKRFSEEMCDRIIFYTLDYSFIKYDQMIHRVWRMGQIKDVQIDVLTFKDTIETKIWNIVKNKQELSDLFYGYKGD